MKKILSIVLAIALVAALTVSALALNTDNKKISTQVYAQPNSDWSWHSPGTTEIPYGETVEVKYTDFSSFANLDSSAAITLGIQNVDTTLDTEGDTSRIVYTMSDVVIKADGYADYVVPATVRDANLTAKNESWGLAHLDDTITLDLAAASGSTEPAEQAKYLAAITEITYTITYNGYNDDVAVAVETATPAEDTTAPAEDTTAPAEDTTAPAETSEPANTGIVLAVLPMAVAAAAVVASKRK